LIFLAIRARRSDFLRCSISDYICKGWCRAAGHSDGTCNADDECLCSEQKLEKYVCSDQVSNATAHTLCAGWCQYKGLQTGNVLDTGLTYPMLMSEIPWHYPVLLDAWFLVIRGRTLHPLISHFSQFNIKTIKHSHLGDCNVDEGVCECSLAELKSGHVKCITDEICSMYCQFKQKKAGGTCQGQHGWDCVCKSALDGDSKLNEVKDV